MKNNNYKGKKKQNQRLNQTLKQRTTANIMRPATHQKKIQGAGQSHNSIWQKRDPKEYI